MATTFSMNSFTTTMTTANATSTTTTTDRGVDPLYIMAIVFCIVIIVVGIVGNIMVLMVFGGGWLKARNCGIYLINMAIANLIGTSVIPTELLLEVMNYGVLFLGDVGCKVIAFLASVSITVSALSLVLITIDRYVIMTSPSRRSMTPLTMTLLSIVTWMIGVGLAVIYVLGERIKLFSKDSSVSVCRLFWASKYHQVYVSVVFGVQVVIPLLFMSVMYGIMACRVDKRSKTTALLHDDKVSEEQRTDSIALRILITVVMVFFICQLPVNVFYYLDMFGVHGLSPPTMIRLYTFLHMIQMASNCVNPILYFCFIRYLHKLTEAPKDGDELYVAE